MKHIHTFKNYVFEQVNLDQNKNDDSKTNKYKSIVDEYKTKENSIRNLFLKYQEDLTPNADKSINTELERLISEEDNELIKILVDKYKFERRINILDNRISTKEEELKSENDEKNKSLLTQMISNYKKELDGLQKDIIKNQNYLTFKKKDFDKDSKELQKNIKVV